MRRWLVAMVLANGACWAGEISIENTAPPIDIELVERVWQYVKQVTGAPGDFPPPKMVMDWEVPLLARMGYQFPTADMINTVNQISIAPRTVDMWPRDIVTWGIGHEMTHYAFLMRENNWDLNRKYFFNYRKHHCDPEFQEITRGIADVIWSTYHSTSDRTKMYDEVQKSCFMNPEQ